MTACPALTYNGVSEETWAKVKAAVEAEMPSLAPMADSGSGQHDGIVINWTYNSGTLTLTAADSWWIGCATINAQIEGMLQPLLGAT
jgi:hypothetical protein